MRIYDVIRSKRDGNELSQEEIKYFIESYTKGEIPDYQASALLMAMYIKGLNHKETYELTMAMRDSGDIADLSNINGIKADKHSTGGVGDKTTLVIGPIVASYGVKFAKMSGRGLGHTGGTVDKLESIPGFKTNLSSDEFTDAVNKIGICVVGQTGNFAPADKKLYALRDVTATVESIPLITASIMSKKLAANSDCILLDVKTGSGAFIKTPEKSIELAKTMVKIGLMANKKIAALITNMDEPLGNAVGNNLEVKEAIETLHGQGPKDFTELCIDVAGGILYLAGKGTEDECKKMAEKSLHDESAFMKFCDMVAEQGGDISYVKNINKFDTAKYQKKIKATGSGYISHIQTEAVGFASLVLGAGRKVKEDNIDFTAGILFKKKTGDFVNEGDVIATIYTNNRNAITEAENLLNNSIEYSSNPIELPPMVYTKIDERNV